MKPVTSSVVQEWFRKENLEETCFKVVKLTSELACKTLMGKAIKGK